LAARSQLLRDFLSRELQRQSKAGDEGRLHALFAVFKDQVFHDLTIGDFGRCSLTARFWRGETMFGSLRAKCVQ
jgi:hypothetical protein